MRTKYIGQARLELHPNPPPHVLKCVTACPDSSGFNLHPFPRAVVAKDYTCTLTPAPAQPHTHTHTHTHTSHLSHARHASLNLPAASSATPTPCRASPTVATSPSVAGSPAPAPAPAPAVASPSPDQGESFRPLPSPSSPFSRARGGAPPRSLASANVPESGAEEEEETRDALYNRSAESCRPSSSAWSARIYDGT